ncbi:MAG: ROK family protein [Verrucomicrobiales bacterium]|nr:ROK family protein [Verrucomicrobiales bacterium]
MSITGIGIDLGGTQTKGACFDLDSGEILKKQVSPTRDGETENGKPAFVVQVEKLVAELGGERAECIGLSAPGLANQSASAIDFMPGRLDGLEDLDWPKTLRHSVFVLNDAHAALLGEIWQGNAKNLQDVILLTLGTGVGGAVFSEGRLLRGHRGLAGHLGHIPVDFRGARDNTGMPGSLEDFIGNHNVSDRSGGRFSSTRDLIDALKSGDETAEQTWDESMRALAAGVAGLVNCFDPEVVLIGGGISRAWEEIEPRIKAYLDQFEWRPGNGAVEIRKAELGEWAGVYGAMSFAIKGNFTP